MHYSKQTNGFYDRAIHGDNIPADAVEITNEEHAALLQGQSEGKIITADENGYPILVNQPPPPPLTQDQIDSLRKSAYQAEADPLFFKAQRQEIDMQEWHDKVAEIRARYPDVE